MEGNEMCAMLEDRVFNRRSGLQGGRMGCTIVTGFLGSGKTTLLRHLLRRRAHLRLAVLVDEFAAVDVDSDLLDSNRLNAAFNLSTPPLTHGGGSCDVRGPFKESLQHIVDSKHNFDCLLIETSGLAEPGKFVAELEDVGIHLDMIVAIVDVESLERIIALDIVKKQLRHVDLVLLNKCDLASFGQISNAEERLRNLTGGAKVVCTQFCDVPPELVIDCSKLGAVHAQKGDSNSPPILSHEPMHNMTFGRDMLGHMTTEPIAPISILGEDHPPAQNSPGRYNEVQEFSSISFDSELPLSLALFQSRVLPNINGARGLLRSKGIIWFAEDRERRFVFQWSGAKRIEVVSGQAWESAPKTCLVFIGIDKAELDLLVQELSSLKESCIYLPLETSRCSDYAKYFARKVSEDGRFKEPSLRKDPLVIFGLKGSPLRGVKESHLNGALMRTVNGRGTIFLTAVPSAEEYNLQFLLDEKSDPDKAWDEVRSVASQVISKLCKNFCPCRDLAAHVH